MTTAVEVVAHRGASAHAPEHTLAAYDLALDMGADVLELDVRLTRDGRLVVLHDPTLLRTAGDPRAIADVAFDELADPRRPLALDEVLDRYGRDTRWLVEMKDPCPAMEDALSLELTARGLRGVATVQSFDHRALRRVHRLERGIAVAPLVCEGAATSEVLAAVRRAARYAAAVGVVHRACSAAVVGAARAHGLALRAFTVNDEAEMSRLIALGVDGLITDRPDRARTAASGHAALMPAA